MFAPTGDPHSPYRGSSFAPTGDPCSPLRGIHVRPYGGSTCTSRLPITPLARHSSITDREHNAISFVVHSHPPIDSRRACIPDRVLRRILSLFSRFSLLRQQQHSPDISPVCIAAMRAGYPDLSFAVMDVADLVCDCVPADRHEDMLGVFSSSSNCSSSGSSSATTSRPSTIEGTRVSEHGGEDDQHPPPPAKKFVDCEDNVFVGGIVQDERKRRVAAGSADAILDKGLMDALVCGSGSRDRFAIYFREYWRALREGGCVLVLAGVSLTKSYIDEAASRSKSFSPVRKTSVSPNGSLRRKRELEKAAEREKAASLATGVEQRESGSTGKNICGPDKHVMYSVGTELVDRVHVWGGGPTS